MKIFVRSLCNWTVEGLDQPNSGERRWGLNVAKLLAKAGHEVVLGIDSMRYEQTLPPKNMTLCKMGEEARFGKFDVYIDPAWHFHGKACAESRFYMGLFWGPGYHFGTEPKDLIKLYPYSWMKPHFEKLINSGEKFYRLCAPFGEKLVTPGDGVRDTIIMPFQLVMNEPLLTSAAFKVLNYLDDKGYNICVTNVERDRFVKVFGSRKNISLNYRLSYDKIRETFGRGLLNIPFAGPSCTLDASFMGCPTLTWYMQWYHQIADKYSLAVMDNVATVNSNIIACADALLNDKNLMFNYVTDFQNELTEHLESSVLEQFNLITTSLGV